MSISSSTEEVGIQVARWTAENVVESEQAEIRPIRNLYAAVMGQAVHYLTKGGDLRAESIEWLRGADGPITFKECCLLLGLSEKAVLLALEAKGLLPCKMPLEVSEVSVVHINSLVA